MSRLIEVWGDTVDSRHLAWSIALGAGLATPAFLLAERLFTATVGNEDLARSYALLTGLVACLVAGYISARLFEPKRTVNEQASTEEGRRAALREIEAESGAPMGDPSTLDPAVQGELRALGLYEVLADEHARRHVVAPQSRPQEVNR